MVMEQNSAALPNSQDLSVKLLDPGSQEKLWYLQAPTHPYKKGFHNVPSHIETYDPSCGIQQGRKGGQIPYAGPKAPVNNTQSEPQMQRILQPNHQGNRMAQYAQLQDDSVDVPFPPNDHTIEQNNCFANSGKGGKNNFTTFSKPLGSIDKGDYFLSPSQKDSSQQSGHLQAYQKPDRHQTAQMSQRQPTRSGLVGTETRHQAENQQNSSSAQCSEPKEPRTGPDRLRVNMVDNLPSHPFTATNAMKVQGNVHDLTHQRFQPPWVQAQILGVSRHDTLIFDEIDLNLPYMGSKPANSAYSQLFSQLPRILYEIPHAVMGDAALVEYGQNSESDIIEVMIPQPWLQHTRDQLKRQGLVNQGHDDKYEYLSD